MTSISTLSIFITFLYSEITVFGLFWGLEHSFYEMQDGGNCFNVAFGKTRGQVLLCLFPYYAAVLLHCFYG